MKVRSNTITILLSVVFLSGLVGCSMWSKPPAHPGPDATPEQLAQYDQDLADYHAKVSKEEDTVTGVGGALSPMLPFAPAAVGGLIAIARFVTGRQEDQSTS